MANGASDFWNWYSTLEWHKQVFSAILGIVLPALIGWCARTPLIVFSYFSPKYRQFYGIWYRYAVGYYPEENNKYPVYKGKVTISFRPLAVPKLKCKGSRGDFVGTMELLEGILYVFWRGTEPVERILSVFKVPRHKNSRDQPVLLIGTKACLTKRGEPAANVEILSRIKLDDTQIDYYLGKRQRIVIEDRDAIQYLYDAPLNPEPAGVPPG